MNKDKKTLIFDLDETLIHCNDNPNVPSDVIVQIVFPTGELIEVMRKNITIKVNNKILFPFLK